MQKLVKSVVFSFAILTFLVNLINISYSVNYSWRYNADNVALIDNFEANHQGQVSENEYNEIRYQIKPTNFTKIYTGLMNWSLAMIKISAIAILAYFVYLIIYLFINKEKRGEKINFKNIGIILLLSFFVSCVFYWFSIDTDYDIWQYQIPFNMRKW